MAGLRISGVCTELLNETNPPWCGPPAIGVVTTVRNTSERPGVGGGSILSINTKTNSCCYC